MKNNANPKVLHIGSVALTLFVTSLGHSALAEGDRIGALNAKVSLVTKAAFVQGEPIVLRYATANVSNQRIGLSWGPPAGYSVSLTDQAGATTVVPQKIIPVAGFHMVPDPFMPAASQREAYFTVPQCALSLHPGRYTLTVRVRLPYTMADEHEENPVKIEQEIKGSGNVYSRVFHFPLLITAPNDSVLRAAAASLSKTILATPFGPEYQADVEALFSMPEAQAEASWKAVVAHSEWTNEGLIADNLGDVGSVGASDLLLKMLDNPALPSDHQAFVSEKLAQIYNSGSVRVRSHLKNTMTQRGINLPDSVTISQPAD